MPRRLLGGALVLGLSLGCAWAQDPPAPAGWASSANPGQNSLGLPSGKVVLTLSGRLKHPNAQDRAIFDMAMLARLPQHSFSTHTPWYKGPHQFTGPLLRDVLAAAGAQGSQIEALAINDYKVSIPMEDALQHEVILARLMDGQPMPLRDKGPLFILYPFDAKPDLRSSLFYSRSVWQLKALVIR